MGEREGLVTGAIFRIALVAPFGLRAKGTTRARVLPLARELARRGHTVALFIPPYDSPEDSGRRWRDKGAASDDKNLDHEDAKEHEEHEARSTRRAVHHSSRSSRFAIFAALRAFVIQVLFWFPRGAIFRADHAVCGATADENLDHEAAKGHEEREAQRTRRAVSDSSRFVSFAALRAFVIQAPFWPAAAIFRTVPSRAPHPWPLVPEPAGVDVINVPLPPFDRLRAGSFGQGGAVWHLWLAWRLLRGVRAWRPDIVHVFKPKGPSGLVAAALWLLRGWGDAETRRRGDGETRREQSPRHRVTLSPCHPVTVSPCHRVIIDSDDWEGPGGWNDDPRAGYTPLQRRFFAWQERFGLSHADAWTVASETLRQRAISFGADAERVFVLPNGVSDFGFRISDFRSKVLQSAKSAIRNPQSAILYTRFAGVAPADVAAIWRRVVEKAPGARLTVVGRGGAGEEAELARLLPEAELLGWVGPEDLPAIFAKTAVAVIPWADTLANRARSSVKVRELMAAGLPVVAYAVGELPETLGEAGVLVPPGDAAAFADAVVGLLAGPERARQSGAAAQARAQALFNWDRLAEIALAAYAAAGRWKRTIC